MTMTVLCHIKDLPSDGCKQFMLLDKPIFVMAREDGHVAYLNECPHLGIELNWAPEKFLDSKGKYIQCSMHGALFEPADGECIYGPCMGDYLREVKLETQGDQVIATLC